MPCHEHFMKSTKQTYTKIIHQELNTMVVNRRWNLGTDICPICMKEIEDWKHITRCTHDEIVSEKKQFIAGFQVILDRHKTYPPLSEFLIDYVTNNDFTEPMEPLILNPRYTFVLHEAFTSQSYLGWNIFSKV